MKINETLSAFKLFFVPRLTHFLLWQGKISNSVGGNIWRRRRKHFWVEKKINLHFQPRWLFITSHLEYTMFKSHGCKINLMHAEVCMKLKIARGATFFKSLDYMYNSRRVHLPQKTCHGAPLENGKIEQKIISSYWFAAVLSCL